MQLTAHDFFDMNRTTEKDNENGKLDLSAILFNLHAGDCDFEKSLNQKDVCTLYDDDTIANGGEKRSVENIMISTASAEIGKKYLQYVEKHGEEKAYEKTLKFYHKQLKKAYEKTFHLKFSKPRDGEVTNLHNLAVRSGHDLLPAEIMFNGKLTSIFVIDPLGEKLSKKEQSQTRSTIDGAFDDEFLGIDFCSIPPDVFCINVDLLLADQTFGEQFRLGENVFGEFMKELEDGVFYETDQVPILLNEVFSQGIYLD